MRGGADSGEAEEPGLRGRIRIRLSGQIQAGYLCNVFV